MTKLTEEELAQQAQDEALDRGLRDQALTHALSTSNTVEDGDVNASIITRAEKFYKYLAAPKTDLERAVRTKALAHAFSYPITGTDAVDRAKQFEDFLTGVAAK